MEKISSDIYQCIDNELYNDKKNQWWYEDSPLFVISCSFNPARISYLQKILQNEQNTNPQGKIALDIGCGGGFLCEELARMGFSVTGIDPSAQSIQTATDHSLANGLQIEYLLGTGEFLPHTDNSVDFVFCCDVLEHVRDLPKVISEISRVLKPGGIFFWDTINRTFLSKLIAINILQDWKCWAVAPPNLHVWEMFIKPQELRSLLEINNLAWKDHTGLMPNIAFPAVLGYLRQKVKGKLSFKEFGQKVWMVESKITNIMYMGVAVKRV